MTTAREIVFLDIKEYVYERIKKAIEKDDIVSKFNSTNWDKDRLIDLIDCLSDSYSLGKLGQYLDAVLADGNMKFQDLPQCSACKHCCSVNSNLNM